MEKRPFRIDPEFQNKIPPIGEEEFKQLRENILAAGEVYEPLVVWNGILVDGHNRWKVIQEAKGIKWRVRELSAPDKWAAFEWMYKNQLGRRNLTDEQRTYMRGKMLESRKKSQGNTTSDRGESGRFQRRQNGAFGKTSVAIAKELGIGQKTVERAEQFAKGVDTLREVSPEAADKVLNGNAKVTKKAVADIAKMASMDVEAVAESIMGDVALPAPKEEPPAYGIDGLLEIVEVNGAKYVSTLRMAIETRRFVVATDDDKARLRATITEIISEIEKVRETL